MNRAALGTRPGEGGAGRRSIRTSGRITSIMSPTRQVLTVIDPVDEVRTVKWRGAASAAVRLRLLLRS